MANEQELFGMPQIIINFRTKGTTAIKRSARGIVAMILHNETKMKSIITLSATFPTSRIQALRMKTWT